MNPQFEQSPGLRLPQPSTEPAGSALAAERAPIQEGRDLRAEAASVPVAVPATATSAVAPAATPLMMTDYQGVTMPAVADDTDDAALDEEWITKAKQIVERTRDDPYVQSNELSKFRSDYLQTRHHRTIKVAEDPSR